jgi:hypothetical protein
MNSMPILFVDFDGVLHPTRSDSEERVPYFLWLPHLVNALQPYPGVRIVVSSTWRHAYPRQELVKLLGPLGSRVAGVTPSLSDSTRYAEIKRYAVRANASMWLALDDDDDGWPSDERHRLILTNPATGISAPTRIAELSAKLAGK